jgi:dephospho-CoA kinase
MPTEGRANLFIVGLMGRAGSGKSTVAATWAQDGAIVIEADSIGHQVTDHDPEVRAALEREYGSGVYRPDGALDRAHVAERVFSDAEARARLDALVHPRILASIRRRIEELGREGRRILVVIDAALMLKWGLERDCDAIVAVVSPEEEQVRRLRASRGWSEAQARARLLAQGSNERFAASADWTIENRGSLDDLRKKAREAMAALLAKARFAAEER